MSHESPKSLVSLPEASLVRLDRSVAFVNNLLAKAWSPEQRRIIDFFVRHPDFFVDLISWHYPLSEAMLERYRDRLNWYGLSCNTQLD
jgi:hypothetical protein